jgi:hypothetical protein
MKITIYKEIYDETGPFSAENVSSECFSQDPDNIILAGSFIRNKISNISESSKIEISEVGGNKKESFRIDAWSAKKEARDLFIFVEKEDSDIDDLKTTCNSIVEMLFITYQ